MGSLTMPLQFTPSKRRQPSASVNLISTRSSAAACVRSFKCSAIHTLPSVHGNRRFLEASRNGNLVPLHRCIFSDHLTPILAYRSLVKEGDHEALSFLFESVEPGVQISNGPYSLVGAQPSMEIVAKEHGVTIMDHEEGRLTEEYAEDPMLIPQRISEGWKPQLVDELPDTFCGGWVGYFSYDAVRYVEKEKLPLAKAPKDDNNLADIHLGLYTDVIVFDHVQKNVYVIHWVRLDQHSSIEKAYDHGMERLERLVSKVHNVDPLRLSIQKNSRGQFNLLQPCSPDAIAPTCLPEEEKKTSGLVVVEV